MKTNYILVLLTVALLSPQLAAALIAQQESTKKVVINKRSIDADGSESSETIVKKGAAAENFDVEQYLEANRAENTQVEVKVTDGEEERTVVFKGSKSKRNPNKAKISGYEGYEGYSGIGGTQSMPEKSAFLGVEPDSDERADEPGLVVQIIRGAAADLAGLRHNDKIMRLNDTPVNQWSDLSKFMRTAKVGDPVRIDYERNGKPNTVQLKLTTKSDRINNTSCEPKGFLGVTDNENSREKNKPGVAVNVSKGSAAEMAGLRNGDVIFQLEDTQMADYEDISDFMAYTKPGDKIKVTYERNGKQNAVEALLTEPLNTWRTNVNNWDMSAWDPEQMWKDALASAATGTVTVQEKDACLGVFSDAFAEGSVVGSRINGFTDASAAREVNMEKGDIITAVDGNSVKGHDDLWNEIARHRVGDQITVEYLREGKPRTASITLKPCSTNSSRVEVLDSEGEQVRNFTSWNWNESDQERLRERSLITIRKGEGDSPKADAPPSTQERSLKLAEFRIFPNPTQGQVTVAFKGDPVATTVSFFDRSGRQLFREELNAFNGRYGQQFDLSDYANDTIIILIQQGDKSYSDQMMVN
jgi:S1-C subfamily serine protease